MFKNNLKNNAIKYLNQAAQDLDNLYNITIPNTITVHLGNPNEEAEDVTVPFLYYIKNVASSELYPTWPESALKANVHAITSFALNRIYTEWYRSRGYDFDITSSPQYDQEFILNRGLFDTINAVADEVFTHYIARDGQMQPLYAKFCDGKILQCEGLQQWGTVDLSAAGYSPIEILRYYYGEDINLETGTPIGNTENSFPGEVFQLGDSNIYVLRMQLYLDRIRVNYPGIPQIKPITGSFNQSTEDAVRAFQSIFNLPVTGDIDKATWYMIMQRYTSITRLAELTTQENLISQMDGITEEAYLEGDIRAEIELIQYALNVLSAYYPSIRSVPITGFFDERTRNSVMDFQRSMGFEPTGVVSRETFDTLMSSLFGILDSLPEEAVYLPRFRWPGVEFKPGDESPLIYIIQEMLYYISLIIPAIPPFEPSGVYDENTRRAVQDFQGTQGMEPTGILDADTWNTIVEVYRSQRYGALSGGQPII
ncbi:MULTISPECIES: peptidoglycan-binding protein [unclassified Sedimentibacter]|uniref:peptidoglycan-binding protein n=1 Tax=unclassified Sedimentibacter TaxID=2649220 RepID=UPI0027E12512|nr:peptidoglycan-binding protein [Sedimentibacter sp. MB35-C1]WMJ77647.1 peptidoglycan-binding protein [Sedimentibacter sp. MB35-C1]